MMLEAFKYVRDENNPNEQWSVEGVGGEWVRLNQINLIVGRNASGKTRIVNAICQIAELLAGDKKPPDFIYDTATYELKFKDGDQAIYYFLDFRDGKVIQEVLRVDEQEKLNRAEGKLYYEQVGKHLELEIGDDLLAVARPDTKQQPFFRSLHEWGKKLTHFQFGSQLGKTTLLRDITNFQADREIDLRSGDNAIEAFLRGRDNNQFVESIIRDMGQIGYSIDSVEIAALKHVPISIYGLNVKEIELDSITDQRGMSQGMFRAFSLLIQLNYFLSQQAPSCVLIDDIGEGLDYERSKSLIDLIVAKVQDSDIQVIMATNDRFVMNNVPLEYWSVIRREKNKSLIYNYLNSRQTFDEFALTGLNNFDFFATDFVVTGFEEYVNGAGE